VTTRQRSATRIAVDFAAVVGAHLIALPLSFGFFVPHAVLAATMTWIFPLSCLYVAALSLAGVYRRTPQPVSTRWLLSSLLIAVLMASAATVVPPGSERSLPLRLVLVAGLILVSGGLLRYSPARRQVILILLSSVTALLIGELALVFGHDPLEVKIVGTPYAKYRQMLLEDPELGFVLKPNSRVFFSSAETGGEPMVVEINSLGLRDREIEPAKHSGTIRIVFVGDSLVFGAGIDVGQALPRQLETALNNGAAPGRHYEVMNWGVGSYCLRQELGFVRRLGAERFRPDLLLVGTGPNDFGQSLNPNTYESQTGALATRTVQRELRRAPRHGIPGLRLYRLAEHLVERVTQRAMAPSDVAAAAGSDAAASTRADIDGFIRYAVDIGVPLAFVLMPPEAIVVGDRSAPFNVTYEVFQDLLKESTPYFDCLPVLRAARRNDPGPLFLPGDRLHFNARGHTVIATALAGFVERQAAVELPGTLE
jgi:lysophospholipase L1-like esterase